MESNLIEKINELEKRVTKLEISILNANEDSSFKNSKQQSLREFLNEKKPTTANDRGLAISYYLETMRGFDSFSAEDIKSGFREARIPVPKNPNDVINKNIAKGLIMDAEKPKNGKKAWVLTETGLRTTEKGFEKEN